MTRLLALALALLAVSACTDTVDPFLDVDRDYTLFGFLDTDTDRQLIRVIPLRRRLDPPPPAPLDATVTLTDLTTGAQITLRDSLATLTDSTTGRQEDANLLVADFRPQMGHTYELVVDGPDGKRAVARTTVPADIRPSLGAERFGTSFANTITQEVLWPGVVRAPVRVEVWYRLHPAAHGEPFRDVAVDYGRQRGRAEGGGWVVDATYTRDREAVLDQLTAPGLPRLYAVGMKLSYVSEDWVPPGGIFDMDALIQPGVFSNVEGGFGFFGSVAQLDAQWVLSPRAVEGLGYGSPVQ
jgi:hypothetical protein